jgi:hypothetical protein
MKGNRLTSAKKEIEAEDGKRTNFLVLALIICRL